MRSSAKVGSWLEKSNGTDSAEAYDSSSEASSSGTAKGPAKGDNGIAPDADDVDDEIDSEDEVEVEVDWQELLPRLRPHLMDRSKKRRHAFFTRQLRVTRDCKEILLT